MKTQLILTLVVLAMMSSTFAKKHKKAINWDDIKDAQTLNEMIRNRGTFVYQLLNVIGNKTEAEEVQKRIDQQDSPSYQNKEHSVYSAPQIELPAICEDKWSRATLVGVLEKGEEFINKWLEGTPQAGQPNSQVFNQMPMLTPEQFATFYSYMVQGVTQFTKEVNGQNTLYFNAEEATKDAKVLMSEANYDLYMKFTQIPWLQFWVYMCSDGVRPKMSAYLSEKDLRPAHQGQVDAVNKAQAAGQEVTKDVKVAAQDQMQAAATANVVASSTTDATAEAAAKKAAADKAAADKAAADKAAADKAAADKAAADKAAADKKARLSSKKQLMNIVNVFNQQKENKRLRKHQLKNKKKVMVVKQMTKRARRH